MYVLTSFKLAHPGSVAQGEARTVASSVTLAAILDFAGTLLRKFSQAHFKRREALARSASLRFSRSERRYASAAFSGRRRATSSAGAEPVVGRSLPVRLLS